MATDKKVALVTGANRGIGFETARQLGQKGVTVFVGARSLKSAEETASKLKTEGIEAFPVKLDVTNAQDREAVAKTIGDKFGKLDILVNNAGVGAEDGILTPKTVNTTEKELQTVFGTNLFATIAVTRSLLPLLKKSSAGRISFTAISVASSPAQWRHIVRAIIYGKDNGVSVVIMRVGE